MVKIDKVEIKLNDSMCMDMDMAVDPDKFIFI